ncbi:MAG: putative ABC transport system ATP-binding protein [Gammaproteobacteria bacterium]|jgi:putative ABC transport system ATP-binding protein
MSGQGETVPAGELMNVTKAYLEGERRHLVVQEYCARFERGRVAVLRGPSGSGKTTILNLLSGIDVPDAGVVSIQGQSLAGLTDAQRTILRRTSIGFVFQFFNLVPTLNVVENARLPLELIGWDWRRADAHAREWLARVDLADRANAAVAVLSGGERQRVALVRALVHSPALVLADEPTGNLDRGTGQQVLSLLATLVREEGRTLVMATHSAEAAALADDVFSMDGVV